MVSKISRHSPGRPPGLSQEGGGGLLAGLSWAGLAATTLVLSCLWGLFLRSEVSLCYCALGLLITLFDDISFYLWHTDIGIYI